MAGFASVGDLETRTITVKELTITPDPTQHLLETEQVTFKVEGDSTAVYALRGAAGAAPTGAVGGLAYTARVLPAGTATADDALELTATYAADHPVFRGGGQLDRDNLLAEQRTNLCQAITLTVDELTVAAPAPMAAGSTVDIETPIAPSGIDIAAPANPAQVTGALRIMNLGGRPGTSRCSPPPPSPSTSISTSPCTSAPTPIPTPPATRPSRSRSASPPEPRHLVTLRLKRRSGHPPSRYREGG